MNVLGGPWQSMEFTFKSTASFKADIQLVAGDIYTLYTEQKSLVQLSGRQRLTARVRVSSWGFNRGGAVHAKLYIQTGISWTWFDSGAMELNSSTPTTLVLDLTRIPSAALANVRAIGVQYSSDTDGAERQFIYPMWL